MQVRATNRAPVGSRSSLVRMRPVELPGRPASLSGSDRVAQRVERIRRLCLRDRLSQQARAQACAGAPPTPIAMFSLGRSGSLPNGCFLRARVRQAAPALPSAVSALRGRAAEHTVTKPRRRFASERQKRVPAGAARPRTKPYSRNRKQANKQTDRQTAKHAPRLVVSASRRCGAPRWSSPRRSCASRACSARASPRRWTRCWSARSASAGMRSAGSILRVPCEYPASTHG